ncbi:MAG: DUF1573 domain-containing protein [Chitinophagaceae bacterium]|nr:DUF1573 domain-containing protein [Chitinophagaceae bacterium]
MKGFFILILPALFFACNSDDKNAGIVKDEVVITNTTDTANLTTIQWIDSIKNLGRINEGQKLEVAFRFKNTGNKPLVIQSVRPGCGCTVADYPKEPIAPGGEGEITGSFDSHGRENLQRKEIAVTANTKGSPYHTLFFEVDVFKPKVQ